MQLAGKNDISTSKGDPDEPFSGTDTYTAPNDDDRVEQMKISLCPHTVSNFCTYMVAVQVFYLFIYFKFPYDIKYVSANEKKVKLLRPIYVIFVNFIWLKK